MSRDNEYLIDIVESGKLTAAYVRGKTKEDFEADVQCQDAVIRRLEIIGEAARRLSAETQATYPQLPWRAMTQMRNLVIHQYDDVDLTIVWDTVQTDLPPLIAALEQIIPPEE
jgi:uncharacterized protein with HEPN domain